MAKIIYASATEAARAAQDAAHAIRGAKRTIADQEPILAAAVSEFHRFIGLEPAAPVEPEPPEPEAPADALKPIEAEVVDFIPAPATYDGWNNGASV